jgi:hypothetical protein
MYPLYPECLLLLVYSAVNIYCISIVKPLYSTEVNHIFLIQFVNTLPSTSMITLYQYYARHCPLPIVYLINTTFRQLVLLPSSGDWFCYTDNFVSVLRSVRAVIAQSVQRWATVWTIGVLGFDSRRELGIFLFTTVSRTALWPTQPPIQWVSGVVSLGVKRPGREADHSPPSSAEVKEWAELYLHSPIRLHGVVLS